MNDNGDSRLLARLNAAIAAETDVRRRASLCAERGGVYARQGKEDLAKAEFAALRIDFAQHAWPELMAWLCMGEAWLAHYTELSDAARDRMKRALALSSACGLRRLAAISAAWLAHFEYSRDAPEQMAAYLRTALLGETVADDGAMSRAYLVAGMAYHFGGRLDLAQAWYVKAREHAVAAVDHVASAAITKNMASIRAGHAQQDSIFGGECEENARHALIAAESGESLSRYTGNLALSALMPMMRAVIAGVQRRYADAIALYDQVLPVIDAQGLGGMRAQMLADKAWCLLQLSNVTEARECAIVAERLVSAVGHVEDQLIAHGRLAQFYEQVGEQEKSATYWQLARGTFALHRLLQHRFLEAIHGLGLVGDSKASVGATNG